MINILEKEPTKCSGVTSLHIIFDFNPNIVTALKQMPKYFYDKKTHEWELPCNCLAELLDTLVYFDDITLELCREDVNKIHYYPKLVKQYKIKPFDHQVEAVEYFLNKDQGLLLDEPGLGKTASIIHLAEELKEQKGLEHCLIVCGINSLKGNWESEIKKHSNLSCRIVGKKLSKKGKISYTSVKERAAELYQPLDAFFYIINVEMLRQDDIIQAIKTSKNKIDMVVVDECHKCFAGDTLITTNRGPIKISDIVNDHLDVSVLSYNKKQGVCEYQKINNYFKNSSACMLKLCIHSTDGSLVNLQCTADHPIYTFNRGYVPAEELTEDDEIFINES